MMSVSPDLTQDEPDYSAKDEMIKKKLKRPGGVFPAEPFNCDRLIEWCELERETRPKE
jgi:hypothetical protein